MTLNQVQDYPYVDNKEIVAGINKGEEIRIPLSPELLEDINERSKDMLEMFARIQLDPSN